MVVKDRRPAECLSRAESLYANVELRGPQLDSHAARNQQIEMFGELAFLVVVMALD